MELKNIILRKAKSTATSPFVIHMQDGRSMTKSAFNSMWRIVYRRTAGMGEVHRDLGASYGSVNVTLDFKVHPHQLRHTYLTTLFEAGLDMKQEQYLAGHASPTVTMSIYTHYRQSQRSEETAQQVIDAMAFLDAEAPHDS